MPDRVVLDASAAEFVELGEIESEALVTPDAFDVRMSVAQGAVADVNVEDDVKLQCDVAEVITQRDRHQACQKRHQGRSWRGLRRRPGVDSTSEAS